MSQNPLTGAQMMNDDANRLLDALSDEAAYREANNFPPMWFERLFGFDIVLWRKISNEQG